MLRLWESRIFTNSYFLVFMTLTTSVTSQPQFAINLSYIVASKFPKLYHATIQAAAKDVVYANVSVDIANFSTSNWARIIRRCRTHLGMDVSSFVQFTELNGENRVAPSVAFKALPSCRRSGKSNVTDVSRSNAIFFYSHGFNPTTGDYSQRPLDYALFLAQESGIPLFTYFADRIGRVKSVSKLLRLEPSLTHVSEALQDIMASFDWTSAALVVDSNAPSSDDFIKAFKNVASERRKSDAYNMSKIEVTQIIEIGFETEEVVRECRERRRNETRRNETLLSRIDIFNKLLVKNDRIVLFHGAETTMRCIYTLIMHQRGRPHLKQLFGKEFAWILTPEAILVSGNPVDQARGEWISTLASDFPGIFGLYYDYSKANIEKAVLIANKMWFAGVMQVAMKYRDCDLMVADFSKKCNCNLLSGNGTAVNSRLERLVEKNVLDMTIKLGDEYIGFGADGHINTTELLVLNSYARKKEARNSYARKKKKEKTTLYRRIGKWERSSRHGKKYTNLKIGGVVWLGDSVQPPRGRPLKHQMKVVTLKEEPFIIYNAKKYSDVKCPESAIECTVGPQVNYSEEHSARSITKMSKSPVENSSQAARNTTTMCCSGLAIDLLNDLKKDLNFDVELYEVKDQKFGRQMGENWNGIIGDLTNGVDNVDMAITSLKITPKRSEYIGFSVPFQRTGITVAVSLREGVISPTAFLEPYDYPSWCAILIFSVHSCGAGLFIFEWLSPHGLDRGNISPREHKFSLFRSLWLIWSMLFGAAVNADSPRGVASRFLANIWALFGLVFLASYTANLAAFMIAKEEYHKIEGIKDRKLTDPMTHKPAFRFGTVASDSAEENIEKNFPSVAEYMKNYNKSSVEEGIKALKNGELDAFIYDANVLEYRVAHDENCRLRTVGNLYAMTGYGVGFPKHSKWLPRVNERIFAYQKDARLERWQKFWMSGACKTKLGELGNTNRTLGVKNFISAFILLVGGMVLCSFLLVMEHAFYRYMRPRLKSFDKYGCCGLISISMGELLSFEQMVTQTVDIVKFHKCSNILCENKLLRAQHDNDTLRRRVQRLEAAIQSYQRDEKIPSTDEQRNSPHLSAQESFQRESSMEDDADAKSLQPLLRTVGAGLYRDTTTPAYRQLESAKFYQPTSSAISSRHPIYRSMTNPTIGSANGSASITYKPDVAGPPAGLPIGRPVGPPAGPPAGPLAGLPACLPAGRPVGLPVDPPAGLPGSPNSHNALDYPRNSVERPDDKRRQKSEIVYKHPMLAHFPPEPELYKSPSEMIEKESVL